MAYGIGGKIILKHILYKEMNYKFLLIHKKEFMNDS